ncbi:MAG: L,D-transpeptidase family protein, partial [Actinobacteria bacterium]|nr:L,D-transpeptidase family protein [Actinomycetota bacterium]
MTQASHHTQNARALVVASFGLISLVISGCSGVVSSSAEAAVQSPALVELAPPFTTTPTTLPPETTIATVTTLPPLQPVVVAVASMAVPLVAVGQTDGPETARVQQRLLDLGFWLQSTNGDYGVTTSQAVMAFQKYAGLVANSEVDDATAAALTNATTRAYGTANQGSLIEVDKDRQLLFIIQEAYTVWTINISSGSGIPFKERDKNEWGKWVQGDAITPNGIFVIDRQVEKGWRTGDLGDIYRPKYFNMGIGLHGAYKIPNYPASHGCVRMSTPAMDYIWSADLAPMG